MFTPEHIHAGRPAPRQKGPAAATATVQFVGCKSRFCRFNNRGHTNEQISATALAELRYVIAVKHGGIRRKSICPDQTVPNHNARKHNNGHQHRGSRDSKFRHQIPNTFPTSKSGCRHFQPRRDMTYRSEKNTNSFNPSTSCPFYCNSKWGRHAAPCSRIK